MGYTDYSGNHLDRRGCSKWGNWGSNEEGNWGEDGEHSHVLEKIATQYIGINGIDVTDVLWLLHWLCL